MAEGITSDFNKIIHHLSQEQLKRLLSFATSQYLPSDHFLVNEGTSFDALYIVLSGKLSVFKTYQNESNQVAVLSDGDVVGEINYFDRGNASASLMAKTDTYLLKIDLKILHMAWNQDIRQIIEDHIHIIMANRIRQNNIINSHSSYQFRKENKIRLAANFFMIIILYTFSFYTLLIPVNTFLNQTSMSTTILSGMMLFFYATVFYLFARHSGFPLKDYGLTLNNAKSSITESILYSTIFIILVTFLKYIAIHLAWIPIQPILDMGGSHMNHQTDDVLEKNTVFLTVILVYMLLCPLQEAINRGAIQGCLEKFINHDKKKSKTWLTIVLSSLIFSSGHVHYGIETALLVFIPGMFWGWMFSKQRNLIGVSISHMMIGVWSLFIMGYSLN